MPLKKPTPTPRPQPIIRMDNIGARLMALGFDPTNDFDCQDDSDGKGPYLVNWKSTRPMPGEAELAAVTLPA